MTDHCFMPTRFHGGISRAEKVIPLLPVEELVQTLRMQAMIRGYRFVTRAWISVGIDSPCLPNQVSQALRGQLTGELFENCQISVEEDEGAEIKLDRMEGILVLPKCSS